MNLVDILGWASSVCFSLSGIPYAYTAIRMGTTDAPYSSIFLVLTGAIGMTIYELCTAQSIPQICDFGIAALCWGTVLSVKLRSKYIIKETT